MFSVYGSTIKLTRGDTLTLKISLTKDGEPFALGENDAVAFAVKTKLNPSGTEYVDADPLITKAINAQDMTLRLDPADTKNMPFGQYFYDIEVTLEDGTVDTVINNAPFIIVPEVA